MKRAVLSILILLTFVSCNKTVEEIKTSIQYYNKANKVMESSVDSCLIYLDKAIEYSKQEEDKLLQLKSGYKKGKVLSDIDYKRSNVVLKDFVKLSQDLEDENTECKIYLTIGENYYYNGYVDSSEIYFSKAVKIKNKVKNKNTLSKLNFYLGILCLEKNEYHKAIEYYNIVKLYADSLRNEGIKVSSNANIAICYERIGELDKSAEYGLNVLKYYEENNYPLTQIAQTRSNLFNALNSTLSDEDILKFVIKTLRISKESKSPRALCLAHQRMAIVYRERTKEYNKSVENYERALTYASAGGFKHKISSLISNQGSVYLELGQFDKSLELINKALKISIENKDNRRISLNYNLKAENYIKQGKFKRAEEYLKKALQYPSNLQREMFVYENLIEVYESLSMYKDLSATFEKLRKTEVEMEKENKDKTIQDLKTKYETEKKEQKIELLEVISQNQQLSLEKAEQEKSMILVGIGLMVLMVVPLGFYARQRNRNKVLEVRINSENNECTRIAKDLHDGVFGSLTTIQYLLETGTDSDYLIKNIESVSNEVRGISHKLNMTALASQSFKQAVSDSLMLSHFPTDVDLKINFPDGFEIKIYEKKMNLIRILQELVNNTLKHAEASRIEIGFKAERKKIGLTYSDNGVGCMIDEVKKGNGLINIQDRVKMLNGEVKFDSQIDQGFYCKIVI